MATVIPVEGEVILVEAPALKKDLDLLIEKKPGTSREEWMGLEGEVFFFRTPGDYNPRATRFMSMRGGEIEVTGTAIFLSSQEWQKILGAEVDFLIQNPPRMVPIPSDDVEVYGNTFPVRGDLRKLGARYDGSRWWIPREKSDEARDLVLRGRPPLPRPIPESPARNKVAGPCSICGIHVEALRGYLIRTNGQVTVRCEDEAACRLREGASRVDDYLEDLFPGGS